MGGLTAGADDASSRPAVVMMAAGAAKRFGGCKPLAPIGLHGEAVIDLNAGDARQAGFGPVVLVLGPATGPAIAYHVRRTWPASMAVTFAYQTVALGTVHAVVSARAALGDRPFAVINADDIYGVDALAALARHLTTSADHALVAYALEATVVSPDPVTRGICETDASGWLRALVERRFVTRHGDGTFSADDGLAPRRLPSDAPVSMNLWGFTASIWPVLDEALRAVYPDLGDDLAPPPGAAGADTEVLLPEVIGAMAAAGADDEEPGRRVRVLPGHGRCVGVTHADDVPFVRTELAEMVGQGLRRESPWEPAP